MSIPKRTAKKAAAKRAAKKAAKKAPAKSRVAKKSASGGGLSIEPIFPTPKPPKK